MATYVLIHGAGDVGWYWHRVAPLLRERGHDVVAPDLPVDDDTAGLRDYADAVVAAVGGRRELVVVGQSYGAFTALLLPALVPVEAVVLVAGMVPAPGERPADWWANTGHRQAVEEQARRDGGLTGSDDPFVTFYHDVPHDLAEQAASRERGESPTAYEDPWPLAALPDVRTGFVLCTEDRCFPAPFLRRVAAERLGVVPGEVVAGHCVALSRPRELADLLLGYA